VSSGDRRVERLEALIALGVPLHLPVAEWPPEMIERVANDPSLLDNLSYEALDALGVQVQNLIRASGGDPDAISTEPMSLAAPHIVETNAHGREPFASTCGCGVCSVWRDRRGGSTVRQ
jgi:hypothetical protein